VISGVVALTLTPPVRDCSGHPLPATPGLQPRVRQGAGATWAPQAGRDRPGPRSPASC
jgi:hypothetical protein